MKIETARISGFFMFRDYKTLDLPISTINNNNILTSIIFKISF